MIKKARLKVPKGTGFYTLRRTAATIAARTGDLSRAVYGEATSSNNTTNYGGYFVAIGEDVASMDMPLLLQV